MAVLRTCVRCGGVSDWVLELCRSCYKSARREWNATRPARLAEAKKMEEALALERRRSQKRASRNNDSGREENVSRDARKTSSQGPSANVAVLRNVVLAGLGEAATRASIREMRQWIPGIVDRYMKNLPRSIAEALRAELASQGFVGNDAMVKFGQEVVSDISKQRQSAFRGVSRGGLPGNRR